MINFHENINIQTLIGLFSLGFCVVMGILGWLLWRFEFLDGKKFYFSRAVGLVLMLASGILALAAFLMLIYVRITLG